MKLCTINLGSLDDLDLADLDVLDGVDLGGLLLDLVVDDLGGEGPQNLSHVALSDFLVEDLDDFLPDGLDLGGEGVGGLALLALGGLREGDREDSEDVPVLGLAVAVGLDESPPLLDEEAQLVPGGVQPVEAGLGVLAFNIVDDEADFPPEVAAGLAGGQIGLKVRHHSAPDGSIDLD